MKNKTHISLAIILALLLVSSCEKSDMGTMGTTDNGSNNNSGIGGSMARFTITGDYLYVVNDQSMKVFDISTTNDPQYVKVIDLGFGIETIFPYGNTLFIGSQSGMQIYDNTNPENPVHLSTYSHIESCDPVVANGKYAYVTLRSGNQCWQGVNRLDVINIEDLLHPTIVASYNLNNPYGLGVDDTTLFVCDGSSGLKVFNVSNPLNVIQIDAVPNISPYDVIPYNKVLMVIGDDGLFQYDYTDPTNLKLFTEIPTKQ